MVKHASASRVSVELSQRERMIALVVQDDGRGFESRDAGVGGGLGLTGMRERVALLGGRLGVESTEDAGTMITAELPLP